MELLSRLQLIAGQSPTQASEIAQGRESDGSTRKLPMGDAFRGSIAMSPRRGLANSGRDARGSRPWLHDVGPLGITITNSGRTSKAQCAAPQSVIDAQQELRAATTAACLITGGVGNGPVASKLKSGELNARAPARAAAWSAGPSLRALGSGRAKTRKHGGGP